MIELRLPFGKLAVILFALYSVAHLLAAAGLIAFGVSADGYPLNRWGIYSYAAAALVALVLSLSELRRREEGPSPLQLTLPPLLALQTKMAKTVLAKQAHWLTLLAVAMTMPLLSACLSGSEPVPIRPEVLSDGCGGVIVTWVHNSKIYAKRLNGEGRPLWPGQEMAVSSKAAISSFHKMVTDDSGGAIIVWMDWRTQDEKGEDLYAQRLSADGRILWKESGVPVCVMPDHQTIADIVSGIYTPKVGLKVL